MFIKTTKNIFTVFVRPLFPKSRAQFVGTALALALGLSILNPASAQTASPSKSELLGAALEPRPFLAPGQSATMLVDGRWLLVGGQELAAQILDTIGGKSVPLSATMKQNRSGHSATLSPDGTVFIFGGVDAAGSVLATAEKFDPVSSTFTQLGDPGLMARTGHRATILADGRLLITGGKDVHGRLLYDAEIYNPATKEVERFNPKLDTARVEHLAALLPNSSVLLWGGTQNQGADSSQGELYDPVGQRFIPLNVAAADELVKSFATGKMPTIKDSNPAADETAAPINQPLVIRFNQRMAVASFNSKTVTLLGPHGAVPLTVVPLEYGLLLFITPKQDLLPDSRYTLFINGAKDPAGQALPFASIGFTTAQLSAASGTSGSSAGSVTVGAGDSNAETAATNRGLSSDLGQGMVRVGMAEQQAIVAANRNLDSEAWTPDASHFRGDWRTRREGSPLQALPPLQAPAGETALAGQVLTLNGRALANATLSIGGESVQTDNTGRFLLSHLQAGKQVLAMDGQAAQQGNNRYGYYQVQVTIEPGITNVLSYTMWSSKLDANGTINLPSPTTKDVVLTSPRIPGLELHLPAGSVIRDHNGKVITQINMTAIPTDRPPFPIPGVGVPVYFTIQPGGATLTNISGRTQQGAQLVYPNFSGAVPGSRIDFWNYDARGKGWYVYGQGTVTPDGKQVMPDKGVAIYEFTGAMISLPSNGPPEGPPCGGCEGGDPVDLYTGLFLNRATDLSVADVVPLEVKRSYRPRDPASRAFGVGTNLSYDLFLVGDISPWTYQELILPDGGRIHYTRTSPGTSYGDAVYTHTTSATKYFGSTISHGDGACYWQLKLKEGTVMCFPMSMGSSNARAAAALSITDRFGNKIGIARDGVGNLTRVTSPSGRYIDFIYDAGNRIISATDNIGRAVTYDYLDGYLSKVTYPDSKFEQFTYDTNHNMWTVQDRRGKLMVTNTYDANNRVKTQTYADGNTNTFDYTLDAANKVTRTEITDERKKITRYDFNASGYPTSITKALGSEKQQIATFVRDPATNLVKTKTDVLGRVTAYEYDTMGNVQQTTRMYGTDKAVSTSRTYTSDFNAVASATDELTHTTKFTYNGLGNLKQIDDANAHTAKYDYNDAGQLIKITDQLGKVTTLSYNGYDLSEVTDPLGRTTKRFTDATGLLMSSTDPSGNRTMFEYDLRDQPTAVVDPMNYRTTADYDGNGSIEKVTDAKTNIYKFSFDGRNAVDSETNPLAKAETYIYDEAHNLKQKTDRKKQITKYTYDDLNRLATVTFADNSVITYTYDQGDRVKKIVDTLTGDIDYTYDDFDRVTSETTARGRLEYTYYANGLRATMTVNGQPMLTYKYDNGNRLKTIDQAAGAANNNVAQQIAFAYDDANRRTQTTLANGITVNYGYDDASQLKSITYKKADASVIGDITYDYDLNGQRTTVGGSMARTSLPEAATSAVDAANRLTSFNGQTLSYDDNGNMTDDGTQRYVWDARNQLSQIKNFAGAVVATFSYDALGRRQSKTINGIATGYVYDGANIVQELNGTASNNSVPANVRASYISGGVDEMFAQLTGTGASAKVNSYLRDALGSTIRLTDGAGNKVVDYTYSPYGTTVTDGAGANPFQYTGRENDGNGLHYYRARYYSPLMARFVQSDPIRLNGGINNYAYVGGNPLSYTDPLGLAPPGAASDSPGVDFLRAIFPNSDVTAQPPDSPPTSDECVQKYLRDGYGKAGAAIANAGNLQQLYPSNNPEAGKAIGETAHIAAEKIIITQTPGAVGARIVTAVPGSLAVGNRIGAGLIATTTGLSGAAELAGAVLTPFGTTAMAMAREACTCKK